MSNKKVYIGYGTGYYYEAVKSELLKIQKLDYICDKKFDNTSDEIYDGIPIIRRNELEKIDNKVIVIFTCNMPLLEDLSKEFTELGYEYCNAMDILGARAMFGSDIKREGTNGICQIGANVVYYDDTLPDNIRLVFTGVGAEVRIGKNLIIDDFNVYLGNNCKLTIGNDVRIVIVEIHVAYANLNIGDDCLFAKNVIIRTHDAHHIFDRKTGKRINYAKDVTISSQVWIAAGAKLLPGASIGVGSVVAANAVTSSKFGDHVIIAGNPAKVIREDILWSKDNTQFASYDSFDECVSNDAEKYF